MRHMLLLVVLVAFTLIPLRAQSPTAPVALAQRIVHTNPTTYRPSPAVHGGAGTMSFTALLNRGAVTPEFNFLHRGVIPAGAGIGHHFHNVVEEMFVILDGEAQFTIDGRTATVKGPAGVLCRTGHSHAIYNAGPGPVQWMNLNVSLLPGVYDNFDLGDTRVGAALFMVRRTDGQLRRPIADVHLHIRLRRLLPTLHLQHGDARGHRHRLALNVGRPLHLRLARRR